MTSDGLKIVYEEQGIYRGKRYCNMLRFYSSGLLVKVWKTTKTSSRGRICIIAKHPFFNRIAIYSTAVFPMSLFVAINELCEIF